VTEVIAANPSAPAKVVADLLHMSEHTLRNHLTEIYAKLGVTGRTHLQALLFRTAPAAFRLSHLPSLTSALPEAAERYRGI
jgi:hypothetical protein